MIDGSVWFFWFGSLLWVSLVLWHCWLSDKKSIGLVETCATYPGMFASETSGGRNERTG